MEPIRKRMMLFNPYACREATAREWADTLRSGGIDTFSPKFANGRTFQAKIQGHGGHFLSPRDLDDCRRLYEDFKVEGITLIPWGIPQGHDWQADADFYADIALVCGGRIEIDLEPYGRNTADTADDFWVGDWANIPAFFARLKERGVEYVICNFDPRPPGYQWQREDSLADPLHLWDAAQYIDHFCSQSYDVGFSEEAGRTIAYTDLYDWAVWYMRDRVGAKSFGIVADARAGLKITERAEFAHSILNCNEMACWAGDFATPDTYAGFAAVPSRPYFEEKVPSMSNNDLYRSMMDEADVISDLAAKIRYNATPGDMGGDTSISDAEAVAAIVGACEAIDRHRLRIVDLAGQVRA